MTNMKLRINIHNKTVTNRQPSLKFEHVTLQTNPIVHNKCLSNSVIDDREL